MQQEFVELHSSADVPLTPTGDIYKLDILLKIISYEVMTMGNEGCKLQSNDNWKLQ